MSDDLPISDFADQLHDDLLVKRLTDSDNTGFSNDLEKGAAWTRWRNPPLGGFFYSLVRQLGLAKMSAEQALEEFRVPSKGTWTAFLICGLLLLVWVGVELMFVNAW